MTEDTGQTKNDSPTKNGSKPTTPKSIIVKQHSPIIYWWPVWVIGFLFAILTFVFGERVEIAGQAMWFHPSPNLGVIYVTVFSIVFFRTNVLLRGMMTLAGILVLVIVVLLLSGLGWWHTLFSMVQHLSIHMDAGFYLVTSLILMCLWAGSIFVFSQFTYCEFRPGQLVIHNLIDTGTRTFDTNGMSVYKVQNDFLRHWVLGLGTGDLHVATSGAEAATLDIHNVAFIDRKLETIKRLIAMSPDELGET
jgi:ABC-type antimicrobial peptide transport system permease subunit